MSKIRNEAEARKLLNSYVGENSDCYVYAEYEKKAWDVALILLDAMHKVESRNYGEGADWEICKKAIAKAEQFLKEQGK